VRNHRDGSVEALFAGDVAVIADMIGACRRGPPGSRIDAIEERDGSADQLAMARNAAFTVLPTA
jgi:acylphosphatase